MTSAKHPSAKGASVKDTGAKRKIASGSVSHTALGHTSTNDIRAAFLDFFAKSDHEIVASSPLVPRHDPTLMFTNAGMVPFKNIFTGQEKATFLRAASSQKCVRAGGKHNDLDNVGYTARHHTFFEMLGNFSFGDYFKERAIPLAWELLTRDFGIDKKRLLITVYEDDDEAIDIWKKVAGLPDARIQRRGKEDNYWSTGQPGPAGPCSEIYFDRGPAYGVEGGPVADENRYIEAATYLTIVYPQPYSKHDWHWRLLVAHQFGHAAAAPAVHGTLRLLDEMGIRGELKLRDYRTGRVETTQMWGRPESVRQEFRRLRSQ